jgi:hypothetical protein
MPLKLVPNSRANEIGPVGVKALLNQQIDLAEVHVAQIDCDFLAVDPLAALQSSFRNCGCDATDTGKLRNGNIAGCEWELAYKRPSHDDVIWAKTTTVLAELPRKPLRVAASIR